MVEGRGGKVAREDEEEVEVEMGLVEDVKARHPISLNKMQDLEDGNNDSTFWALLGKVRCRIFDYHYFVFCVEFFFLEQSIKTYWKI